MLKFVNPRKITLAVYQDSKLRQTREENVYLNLGIGKEELNCKMKVDLFGFIRLLFSFISFYLENHSNKSFYLEK